MSHFRIGAIKRSRWALIALVFILTQFIPLYQFSPVAEADDAGLKTPGAAHAPNNWDTNAVANIQSSDNVYVSDDDGQEQGYSNFGFSAIPADSIITGIQLNIEANSTDNTGCRVGAALSWNNGTNYSSYKYSPLSNTDTASVIGSSTDTWGRVWAVSDFTNANFVIKIQDDDPGNDCTGNAVTSVDYLDAKVFYTPVSANPSLTTACGLDIALVIDNSSSIDTTELNQMKTALTTFTNALSGTPTQFSVTQFNTAATVSQTFTSNVTNVNAAINAVPQIPSNPNPGYTNWEDGLLKANSTFPNRAGNPDLVIFATDGDPTTSNTVGGIDTNQPNAHLVPAVTAANTIKNGNKRILAIGIGMGADSLPRLEAISGTNDDTGSVLTSDVITANFSTLAASLATFARQTCGGTITTTKLIDADGNPQTTTDRTPASNWQFDINGGSNPAATSTDATGKTPAVGVTVASGYSVNETVQPGYVVIGAQCTGATANGTWAGNAVTGLQVAANDIVSCTFINKRATGTITVTKVVTNDNGGTKQPQNFSFTLNGQTHVFEADGTNVVTVPTDAYTVAEVNPNTGGYATSYNNCTNVVVTETNNPTCIITNNDIAPTVTVNKVVEGPTYGVTPDLNGFGLTINGAAVNSGQSKTITAGQATTVNEQGAQGYEFVRIEGTGCPASLGGTVTLALGESITCNIVNKASGTYLNITKNVVTDNGGSKLADDFKLYANNVLLTDARKGGADDQGSSVTYLHSNATDNEHTLVGEYTLTEDPEPGYAPSGWSCTGNSTPLSGSKVTVKLGENINCEITNNDEAPILTLLKSISDQWNSGAVGSNFTLKATKQGEQNPALSGQDANATDQASTVTSGATFQAGTYNLAESSNEFSDNAYIKHGWYCTVNNTPFQVEVANITLNIGDTASCYINNEFKPAKLTVVKNVTNDSGGTGVVGDFDITLSTQGELAFNTPQVNGPTSTYSTQTYNLPKGNYTLSELKTSNYTEGAWSCGTADTTSQTLVATSLSLTNGDDITCTITNDDIAATLQLVKKVVGNGSPTTWTLSAQSGTDAPVINQQGVLQNDGSAATSVATILPGTYTLAESTADGYDASEWQCTSGTYNADANTITLLNNQNAVCTITNTERVDLWVEKYVDTNNDGKTEGEPKATVPFGFTLYNSQGEQQTTGLTIAGSLALGNYTAGTYTVCEATKDGWLNTYAGPGNIVADPAGQNRVCVAKELSPGQDWTFVFGNYEIPKPVTINATKIVCSKESELPNWGNGGPDITNATATDWVNSHSSCQLTQGWEFQWSYDDVGNPGDNVEYGGQGWTTFGPTNASGQTQTTINDVANKKLRVREVLKPGYLEFTGDNQNNYSAEFYCNTDVASYDNWEWFEEPQPDTTYYCVAWNFKKGEPISGTKWLDKNANGKRDHTDGPLQNWKIFIDANNNGTFDQGEATATTNALGAYTFLDLQPGTYKVCEEQQQGYIQTYPASKCHDVKLTGAPVNPISTDTATYNFGNAKAGTIIVKKKFDQWHAPCKSQGEFRCESPDQPSYEQFGFTIKNESTHKTVYKGNFDKDGQVKVVLPEGTYTVKEDSDDQYSPSYDDCKNIRLSFNATKTCTITNSRKPADITVKKQDYSLEGVKDPIIDVSSGNNAFYYTVAIKNTSSFAAQNVTFVDDLPSMLKATNIQASDPAWDCEAPSNDNWGQKIECEYNGAYAAGKQTTITIYVEAKASNADYILNFACVKQAYAYLPACDFEKTPQRPDGKVVVTKYHDKNQNGVRDDYFGQGLEPTLAGITFELTSEDLDTPLIAVTNAQGIATFVNVPKGSYEITEVLPEDSIWQTNEFSCFVREREQDGEGQSNSFTLHRGDTAECTVGNVSTTHLYDIAKANDAETAKHVGDMVIYTLTLTIPDESGVLYAPVVGDIMPKGFGYLPGSWTATSNLRGNLATGIAVEPTYGPAGVWRFNGFDIYYGDDEGQVLNNAFYPGEVITLTYQTRIANDVTAGVYPDVALSYAFTSSDPAQQTRANGVLANVTNQDGTTPFVGTEVTVITDPPAAEPLVNTGSGALWALMLGTALIVAGTATRRLKASERRMQ